MISSNIPSSFSAMNPTATSSRRFSGLISGLDTDTLVQQFTSGIQSKIDKQMQNKQLAIWRQQSYRQVTSALTEFKDKYFSATSNSSNISDSRFFNSTTINNTSPFLNVSGNADVAKNMTVTEIGSLAKQAGFTSTHKVSNQSITTGKISASWSKSKVSHSSITLTYGGKDYTVSLSNDFAFDSTAEKGDTVKTTNIKHLIADLNTQISKIDDLKSDEVKNKVSFSYSDGKITLTGNTQSVTIKDGSENLLKGLGLTKGDTGTGTTGITGSPIVYDSLFIKEELGDSLAGSTLTFNLNGVSRNIVFKESEKEDSYSNPTELRNYLQDGLNVAFGEGKIVVDNNGGNLSFKTTDTTSSILSISSCSKSGVLGINGALRVYAGETNRINTHKTLDDIQSKLNDELKDPKLIASDDGTYGFKINNIEFKFKSTDTIDTIMKRVNNDSDANVTISYSTINDSFTVTAKNGGANSKIKIENLDKSNLSDVLFGKKDTASIIQNGENAELMVSFNGAAAIKIERTENKFSLDGVNFELLGTMDSTGKANPKVTVAKPIKFSTDTKSDELYTKIKDFVDDYNALIELINKKVSERKETGSSYSPLTDTQKKGMSETQIKAWETKAKKGILQGNWILKSLSLDLRKAMTDQVKTIKGALYQIGIESKAFDYSSNGKLVINEEKVKKALNDNPQKVIAMFTEMNNNSTAAMFAETNGIAARLQRVINKNIKTVGGNGILVQKAGFESGTSVDNSFITNNLHEYDKKIVRLKTRLLTQQEQYYRKFTRLEQYLSRMNSQASLFMPSGDY